MKVMSSQCDQCLLSANKIVSDARRNEIVREARASDSYFVCHKATQARKTVVCRGYFDAYGGGQMGRIAERLGCLEFVEATDAK